MLVAATFWLMVEFAGRFPGSDYLSVGERIISDVVPSKTDASPMKSVDASTLPTISITCNVPKSEALRFQTVIDEFSVENWFADFNLRHGSVKLSFDQTYKSSVGLLMKIVPDYNSTTDRSFSRAETLEQVMADAKRYNAFPPYYEKQTIYMFRSYDDTDVTNVWRSLKAKLFNFECVSK